MFPELGVSRKKTIGIHFISNDPIRKVPINLVKPASYVMHQQD